VRAADRLNAVRLEGLDALAELGKVLSFVQASTPPGNLRVLIVNNVIVAAVSVTEEVLRELFIEYLRIIEERVDSHKKLRGELRQSNADKTITELKKILKMKNESEALNVIEGFRRCLAGEPGYRLEKEGIARNEGNFRSSQVTDIAKLIGLSEIWSKIANTSDVSTYAGIPLGDELMNKVVSDWNAIYDERDTIVHRISLASGWSSERVEQGIELLILILNRLTGCLIDDVLTVIPAET
jgi:hypothetical protein